jgi:hypothetical protein
MGKRRHAIAKAVAEGLTIAQFQLQDMILTR